MNIRVKANRQDSIKDILGELDIRQGISQNSYFKRNQGQIQENLYYNKRH